jgi:ABC-type Mn2+/Zn2+ transport system ATPase subunit
VFLETVTLADAADSQLGTSSGGMHQPAGIAQALLDDPELLVIDDPTVGPTSRDASGCATLWPTPPRRSLVAE